MTIATVAVFGVILLVGVIAISLSYPVRARADLVDQASAASRHVIALIDKDRLDGPIPSQKGVYLLQVVDDNGQVVASNETIPGMSPITKARPGGGDTRVEDRVCRSDGCLVVVGISDEASAYGSVIAYSAMREPLLLRSHFLPALLYGGSLLLVTLLAWGAWFGVGRVLAPVERIRSGLERISAHDLSRRIEVPKTDDEVAELATTVNDTLARLEDAVARHRRFVSDASHELRAPITALMVRLEAGMEDRDEADWRAALEDARRLSAIVHDLLLMARLDAGATPRFERIDLGRLVADEVSRRPTRLPVTTDIEPGVHVRGSPLRLLRLLTNLLANADRYGESKVRVSVRACDDQAVVEVADDGPGIPEEKREQVFERFTRLDQTRSRDTGGSGLGLPIARDIAKAHRGTLTIGEGSGARLILRLPRSRLP
ncbi:HAMP domain-containing sensor histidine kinase [Nonomuraea sp. NPDC046802]|uniref:sensor histidine kinase n=1 Tax=Nonomuraea sp. NPDC046802 TaxID=3154919 RepID=UPI003410D025